MDHLDILPVLYFDGLLCLEVNEFNKSLKQSPPNVVLPSEDPFSLQTTDKPEQRKVSHLGSQLFVTFKDRL